MSSDAVAVARLARGTQEVLGQRMDAGLALDRLEHDRGRLVGHRIRERALVIARYGPEPGHEGREGSLLCLLWSRGEGAHRAPVKAALGHHEATSGTPAPGQFERALDGLGTGVAEKHLAAERVVRQPRRQAHARARCSRGCPRASGVPACSVTAFTSAG